jgi:hypothetical protein
LVGANQNRYARPKGNLSTDCEGGGTATARGGLYAKAGRLAIFRFETLVVIH